MCKSQVPYFLKWILGAVMTIIGIVVIISVFYGSGGSQADVVMQGEENNSVVQQSSGFHVIEVHDSGVSGKCNGWSWSEIALGILGFVFLLKITHLLHYCLYTKAVIKRKVSKIEMELRGLNNVPASNDVVIVPPLPGV
jgi:hypothetical protein